MNDDMIRDLVDEIECAADDIGRAVSRIKTIIDYAGYEPAVRALPYFEKAIIEAMALMLFIHDRKNNARLS